MASIVVSQQVGNLFLWKTQLDYKKVNVPQ